MGRYRVNLTDLAEVGAKALLYAVEAADIVVCDEVGPMELFSPEFIRAVRAVLASGKPVLGVIHQRMKHPLLNEIRAHPECRVVEVTYDNRDRLADELVVEVLEALKGGG
jgi:nucleoside-triphosphatase